VYRREAELLGELGAVFAELDLSTIEVQLPRRVAELALAAWQREGDDGPPAPETFEQRVMRHRTATLSLIGMSIDSAGRWADNHVKVRLHPQFVGEALAAADDESHQRSR
jgi:predicted Zn-dependent protease